MTDMCECGYSWGSHKNDGDLCPNPDGGWLARRFELEGALSPEMVTALKRRVSELEAALRDAMLAARGGGK